MLRRNYFIWHVDSSTILLCVATKYLSWYQVSWLWRVGAKKNATFSAEITFTSIPKTFISDNLGTLMHGLPNSLYSFWRVHDLCPRSKHYSIELLADCRCRRTFSEKLWKVPPSYKWGYQFYVWLSFLVLIYFRPEFREPNLSTW